MLFATEFDLFDDMDMGDHALDELLASLPLPAFDFGVVDAAADPALKDVPKPVEVPASLPLTTHSRKHKHRTRVVPRAQRERSTQSYLFPTVQHEADYRLFATQYDKRAEKLNKLLRQCYARFADRWVTWNEIKQVALEVGYSKSNSLFRTMWPMVCSRYGRFSSGARSCEVLGLNFPYWVMDESTRPAQGLNAGNTLLRLAPEFFYGAPPAPPSGTDNLSDLLLDVAPVDTTTSLDFAFIFDLTPPEPAPEDPCFIFSDPGDSDFTMTTSVYV